MRLMIGQKVEKLNVILYDDGEQIQSVTPIWAFDLASITTATAITLVYDELPENILLRHFLILRLTNESTMCAFSIGDVICSLPSSALECWIWSSKIRKCYATMEQLVGKQTNYWTRQSWDFSNDYPKGGPTGARMFGPALTILWWTHPFHNYRNILLLLVSWLMTRLSLFSK